MLYTTYISRIKDIPDNARKIIVMRYMPKSLKDPKYDLEWRPELAPTDILLNNYKKGNLNFIDFVQEYEDYLNYNKLTQASIDDIIESMEYGKDVYLICCEKDDLECHRRFLMRHICEDNPQYKGGEML